MSKTMDNDTDSKSPYVTSRDLILAQTAEIERLKAELAAEQLAHKETYTSLNALKPVPDVETQFYFVDTYMGQRCSANPNDGANIKLTFTDGKLTGAEVVGQSLISSELSNDNQPFR